VTAATERFPVHPADTGPESGNGCKKKTSGTDRATEWSAIALRNNSTGRDPLTPIRRVFSEVLEILGSQKDRAPARLPR
jgi:hypothetical protein